VIFNPLGSFVVKFLVFRWYYINQRKITQKKKKLVEKLVGEEMLKVMNQFKEMGKATVVLKGKKKYTIKTTEGDIKPQESEENDNGED